MDILQYLIELLKIRKEIGIEGLGTLYKKKTPGRYDAETHSFLPPSHVLSFRNEVSEHVHLVQYIQRKRSISEESASYFITGFVEEVNKALAKDGNYTLDNLGDFTLSNGELYFTPTQEINIGFDFFALPTVAASLPNMEEKKEESADEEQKPDTEILELPTTLPILDEEPIAETRQVDEAEAFVETKTPVTSEEEPAVDLPVQAEAVELHDGTSVVKETQPQDEHLEDVNSEISTDNNAKEDEVVNEIADVNTSPVHPENIVPEGEQPQEVVDDVSEVWAFDDKDVISENDIAEEKFEAQNNSAKQGSKDLKGHEKKSDSKIRITTATNDWDFDKTAVDDLDDERESFYDPNAKAINVDTKKTSPWYQKLIIGIFILAAILFAAYLYNPNLFNGFTRDNNANPNQKLTVPVDNSILKTQQDSLSFADSIMQSAEQAGLKVEPAKDTLKVTAKAKPLNVTTYEIIGAALATKAEVTQYIATMKRNGFDAKVAENMPGKIYRKISIASYTNRDSATNELKKLRVRLKNPDLYIFEDKNK